MHLYKRPKSPGETIDYGYTWSNELSDGETIVSASVVFVDAGGTTNPSPGISSADAITRVWLAGGTHGQRVVYTVTITTSGGRTLDEAFGVDIVDSVTGPAAETDIAKLTRMISEAVDARHKLATGTDVVDVWRDGRRMRFQKSKIAELDAYITNLRSDLTAAQVDAGVTPTRRRRAIGLAWRG